MGRIPTEQELAKFLEELEGGYGGYFYYKGKEYSYNFDVRTFDGSDEPVLVWIEFFWDDENGKCRTKRFTPYKSFLDDESIFGQKIRDIFLDFDIQE